MFGIIAPYSIVYTVVVWLIWGFQLDNLGQDQQMTNSVKFLCLERLSLVFLGTGTFFLSAIEESQSCTCFQHGCSYKVDATSWRIEPAGRAILGFCCSLVIGHFFLYMHLVWLVFLMNMIFNGICDFLYFWILFANVFFINMLRAHIFESRYSRCSSSSCCGYQVINLNQMALWIGRTLAGWTDSYHTLPMLRVHGPDSHSAAALASAASENNPNAETVAVTVGTPLSKGPKNWGEGKLVRQERKWDGRSRRVTGTSVEHVRKFKKTQKMWHSLYSTQSNKSRCIETKAWHTDVNIVVGGVCTKLCQWDRTKTFTSTFHQFSIWLARLISSWLVCVCVCDVCVFSFLRQEDEKPEVVALCNWDVR